MANRARDAARSRLRTALNAFEDSLTKRAYKATTKRLYLRICERFNDYVMDTRVDTTSLAECHVEAFVQSAGSRRKILKRDGAVRRENWGRPLRLYLDHLRQSQVTLTHAPERGAKRPNPIVAEFSAFLRSHRGLCDVTIEEYGRSVARLIEHAGLRTECEIRELSVAQVDRFLIESARDRARCSVNTICNGIRAFLRYAHVRGLWNKDISSEITMPRIYSLERLPRFLPWSDVERTLGHIDRSMLVGCRDYAILVLLARCGLRGGEVAALELRDLDWRNDTIRLRRRKSNTIENIPLVPAIGEALIDYLRRRPRSTFEQLFLKVLAPIGPMSRAGIGQVVKGRLKDAGVHAPHWGSHTLRHSFAAELLRQGITLKTIGDALGHHHPESTFIYTKAAVDDLREVCLSVREVLP